MVKVLIIEDDETQQIIIKEMVKWKLGPYLDKITSEWDGIEGIEAYRKHRHDIVITDLNMPEMDGNEVVEIIRDLDPEWNTTLAMFTDDIENCRVIDKVDNLLTKDLGALETFLEGIVLDLEVKASV